MNRIIGAISRDPKGIDYKLGDVFKSLKKKLVNIFRYREHIIEQDNRIHRLLAHFTECQDEEQLNDCILTLFDVYARSVFDFTSDQYKTFMKEVSQ